MPLGIIELLTRIGEEHVFVQNVVENMTNITTDKRGVSKVTFVTPKLTAGEVMGEPQHVGLVLWLPADLVKKAQAEHTEVEQNK